MSAGPRLERILLSTAAALVLTAYLGTGFYAVNADEQAVVRRFGALSARVGPGIHYRLPWPIDRVDTVKTTSVMKTGVGFELSPTEDQTTTGMTIITGDTNILSIALVLQYTVANPADYLFRVDDPRSLIGGLAEAALTETVIGMPVDDVLTTGRLAIQDKVKSKTQALLERYHSGIQLVSANIMTIALDKSVAEAFQNVANALADREKKINEAQSYRNNLIPKARGEARTLVLEAESYKEKKIAEAVGNTQRFLALLAEYEKAPAITRERLYLEAMEKVLPAVKKYIIDTGQDKAPINLRVAKP
ncbi:MAG: FtsH protease activity modulator HflK [Gammaproteobacteria bacterium]